MATALLFTITCIIVFSLFTFLVYTFIVRLNSAHGVKSYWKINTLPFLVIFAVVIYLINWLRDVLLTLNKLNNINI